MAALPQPHARTRPIRVGIVDDSEPVRVLIRALIGLEGDMEVAGEAANGDEALDLVARGRPDVLILDLAMPVRDGISVLARLRTKAHGPRVVVYSCDSSPDSERAARALGARDFLVKGVSPQLVVESARRAALEEGREPGPPLLVVQA